MKIQTLQFGEVEFDEDFIIKFEDGLCGFEQLKKYLLIKVEDELFSYLTSVDTPEIVFPLIPMRLIYGEIPEGEHEPFGIVNLNSDVLKITVNLKAPVYINQNTKTGYQKILDSDKFLVNYNLFKE